MYAKDMSQEINPEPSEEARGKRKKEKEKAEAYISKQTQLSWAAMA